MPITEMLPFDGCTKPVIRFISVVLPLPLGPTSVVIPGGIERDAVDTQHFAVELRDVIEYDAVAYRAFAHPRTTSLARTRLFNMPTLTRQAAASMMRMAGVGNDPHLPRNSGAPSKRCHSRVIM